MKTGTLYWITGLSGAGKTTVGIRLYYRLKNQGRNAVLLDGDIIKNIVGKKVGYTAKERLDRAYQYTSLCELLTNQGVDVVICTIAMFDEVRRWNRTNIENYIEVFIDVKEETLKRRNEKRSVQVNYDATIEFPKSPDITIFNEDGTSIEKAVDDILLLNPNPNVRAIRESGYWDGYYNDNFSAEMQPSLFAKEMLKKHIFPGWNLLELGCGNGRDALFFARNNVNVVAIDSSSVAICKLQELQEKNAYFICDDFANAKSIYQKEYDVIYSRFTMHSITYEDQTKVIGNAFTGLKTGGLFMVEARTVNDDFCGIGKEVARDTFIKDGHTRRFIRKEEFEKEVINAGFEIIYSKESTEFAPYKDEKPAVLRIIARK